MLNVEIEKRYTVQQVKAHKWMKQLKEELNDSYEINQTIGDLDRLNINFNSSSRRSIDEAELREECSQLALKFNLTSTEEMMISVRERRFDDNYALYHLSKDFGISVESPSSQTLPSSPASIANRPSRPASWSARIRRTRTSRSTTSLVTRRTRTC